MQGDSVELLIYGIYYEDMNVVVIIFYWIGLLMKCSIDLLFFFVHQVSLVHVNQHQLKLKVLFLKYKIFLFKRKYC